MGLPQFELGKLGLDGQQTRASIVRPKGLGYGNESKQREQSRYRDQEQQNEAARQERSASRGRTKPEQGHPGSGGGHQCLAIQALRSALSCAWIMLTPHRPQIHR
jgi:hypothetical protein